MTAPSVSAALAERLADFAAARGATRPALLLRSGIAERDLADPDARVPLDRYVALTRAAKALTGDPALALHYGEEVALSDISVVGLLGEASATLVDALVQLNRYGRLVIDVDLPGRDRFETVFRGDERWMVDRRDDPNIFPELTEATFARMICGVRRFAPELGVEEVHVTHAAPPHAAEYERAFRAPVVFGSHWNAYRARGAWLTHRLNLQPRYVFGILATHADALIAELAARDSATARVEAELMPILHTGTANIQCVATRLAMSRQTLYRRLKAEGTTFEGLLDRLRHRMALDYLSARRVSVAETAYLLGFSDPAAFSRAFKRWTGQCPRAMRIGGQQAEARRAPRSVSV